MLSFYVAKFLLTLSALLFVFNPSPVSAFHIDSPSSLGNLTDDNLRSSSNGNGSSSSNSTSAKGNINISSLLSIPTQLTNQLTTTLQSILSTLNSNGTNSLNSTISQLVSSVKNLTSSIKPSGSSFRLDNFIQNVTEVLRNSTDSMRQDPDVDVNSINSVENGVQLALQNFERSVLQLRSDNWSHAAPSPTIERRSGNVSDNDNVNARDEGSRQNRKINGWRRMWDQLTTFRAQMDQSILEARSRLEDSMSTVARQGPHTMRNQTTTGFMNEIERVFTVITEPLRQFVQGMRKRLPTNVVNA